MTEAQSRAIDELGGKYIIDVSDLKPVDPAASFGREAPLVLEIGFGMGASFVQMAKDDPDRNYLGIEVHPPGVGSCLKLIEENGLTNARIIWFDAFEVLRKCMRPESIDILQVFFPDPWPKKRHIKRRLISDDFIKMVAPLLKHGAQVRLATDWEDYANQMLDVMTRAEGFTNTAPDGRFVPRPQWRPLTKFERRGERLGHGVWDLVFTRD
jgi:tRNA (guanine-N7-)-methyltransferase